jgi:hypothetical protein
MFDIVTMHGVWSWIAPELRAAIVAFLSERMNPGAMLYVSYNALPGWSNASPLQRLLKMLANQAPVRSDLAAEQSIQMMARMAQAKALPERMHEDLGRIQDVLNRRLTTYLAHEYLNEHWGAFYHMDVAAELGQAKLAYAGSTDLMRNFQNMVMTREQHDLVAQAASPDLRETLKDFCGDTRFRSDIYVRGVRRMTVERRRAVLGSLRMALVRPPPEAFHLTLPDGDAWRPEPSVYIPALQALRERPHRVAELLSLPGLPEHTVDPVELIGILVGASIAAIYTPPSTEALEAAARLNAVSRTEFDGQRIYLSVPGLGGGQALRTLDLVLYDDLRRGIVPDATDLARRFIDYCRAAGGRPMSDGKPLENDEEAMTVLTEDYVKRIEQMTPLWRMFQMI